MQNACPCNSGSPYPSCCGRFHKGEIPKTPLELMRSRYSAYAKGLVEYIIETTHPDNPNFTTDRKEIKAFIKKTQFKKLEILDFNESEATVTFMVHLNENTFMEKSYFERLDGKWLYLKGELVQV